MAIWPNTFPDSISIPIPNSTIYQSEIVKENYNYTITEKIYKPNPGKKILALLKKSTFRRHFISFIQRMLNATHAKKLYLKLRIGLGDPAGTGELWAVMGPVSGILRNIKSMEVELESDFIDPVLEIESHGQFRFIPLQFLVLTLVFIFSPTTIHAWRSAQ